MSAVQCSAKEGKLVSNVYSKEFDNHDTSGGSLASGWATIVIGWGKVREGQERESCLILTLHFYKEKDAQKKV